MQDFSRQVAIAIRWLPLILVCAMAAGGLAYLYASSRPVVLEAVGTLGVSPGRDASVQDRADAVLAALAYASDLTTPSYARAVIKELQLDDTPQELLERVNAEADGDADVALIQIGVESTDPEKAQAIARTLGNQLIEQKTAQLVSSDVVRATAEVRKLEGDLDALRRALRNLRTKQNKDSFDRERLDALPLAIASLAQQIGSMRGDTRAYVRNIPSWIVQPRLPTEAVAAGPLYWTILALVVGGMLGVAIAFVLEYLRRANKVRDDRDLELATGLPALGSILEPSGDRGGAEGERLVMMRYPRSDGAEAYRDVIARMGFSGGSARTLAITSAKPTDANGLVAANIALAYAEAGRNVILVDADYRSPRIHSFFGVSNDRGLTTILTDSSVPLGWATVPTVHPRLGLMPSGPLPRETAEPLGARQINALLRRLLQAADLVVVHSPSMQGRLDAAVLAEQLDAVLLVVPHGSKANEIEEASRSLQLAEAEFVGAVLYRTVRRARKGARVEVAPAPDGWGPTWPGLYDAPAQIAAVAKAGPEPRPTSAPMAASVPQPTVPPFAPNGRGAPATPASGPFAVPFRPERSVASGMPPASQPPAQPAPPAVPPAPVAAAQTSGGAPAAAAQAVPPAPAPPPAAPPPTPPSAPVPGPAAQPAAPSAPTMSAPPAQARPLQAVGPGVTATTPVGPYATPSPASESRPFAAAFQAAPLVRPASAQPDPVLGTAPTTAGSLTPAEHKGNGVAPLPGPVVGSAPTTTAPSSAEPSAAGGSNS